VASGAIASEGNWAACTKCRDLIVAGEREKLAKRGMRATLAMAPPGTPVQRALEATREVQDRFWENREGEPHLESREDWDKGVAPSRLYPPGEGPIS